MKIRNSFVSNSSSSSFVILKDSLSERQIDMILDYIRYVKNFIKKDEEKYVGVNFDESYDNPNREKRLKFRFEYYNSDPWNISEYEDFIFGETSMDNFDMQDYFYYLGVDDDYVYWDEGYIDEPQPNHLSFIKQSKQKYRKEKLNKIEKRNENS